MKSDTCHVSSNSAVLAENEPIEMSDKNKPVKRVKFVQGGKLNDEAQKIEKSSNAEFIQKKILKNNQPPRCPDKSVSSQPSTSDHCGHKNNDSSSHRNSHQWTYVERRTCFQCGIVGHVFADCQYKNKETRHEAPQCPQRPQKQKTVRIQVEHPRKSV
ncbi:hypothetical protein E9993_23580, partial [Labilibacter sediminis]